MEFTIRELSELILWLGGVIGALGVIYLGSIKPMSRALDKKIEKVAAPVRDTANKLGTHNGKNVGELIESMASDIKEMKVQQQTMNATMLENRTMILHADKQFLEHLIELHRKVGD